MKQKQNPQILFKYIQSDEFDMKQENKTPLNLITITTNYQPIYELIIENCQTFILDSQVSLQLEKLQTLKYLGINGCQIKSLIHLPLIDSLKRLTLDNNQIKEDQLKCLIYYKDKLLSLSLVQNHLKITGKSGALQFFQKMNSLKQLSIIGNLFIDDVNDYEQFPIESTDYVNIRTQLFNLLPNLQYIDCIEKNKSQYEETYFNNQNEENEYLSKYLSRSVTQLETSRSASVGSVKKVEQLIKKEYNESEDEQEEQEQDQKETKQTKETRETKEIKEKENKKVQRNMQLRKQKRKHYNFE